MTDIHVQPALFTFIKDGKPADIFFPVFFAAFGTECVEAISRIGVVRTVAA